MTIEKTLNFYEVEIPKKELDALLANHAFHQINSSNIDSTFNPTIVGDGYNGFKVYVKKK